MPIPLVVPLAIGLGLSFREMLGQREAREKKAAGNQTSLDRLDALMTGGSLASNQAGPPVPAGLASGFSPREQNQLQIVAAGPDGGAAAVALAEQFKAASATATQQQFANDATSEDLQLRQQSGRLAAEKFGFDVEKFLFEKQGKTQESADAQRILVDPAFAAKKAAQLFAEGTGKGNYPVWDEQRQVFGTAFIPGTDEFKAAEGAIVTTTDTLSDTSELRDLLRQVDVVNDPASLATGRVQSLTSSLQLQFKNIADLGVVSETDFDQFISKGIPDATDLKTAMLANPAAVDQRLVQFTRDVQRANQVAVGNVQGWEGITDEILANAAQSQKKATAQNQVAGRELLQEIDQTRTRQQVFEEAGIGRTAFDDRLLEAMGSPDARERLQKVRDAGFNPDLIGDATLNQLGGGAIDTGGGIGKFLLTLLGGRFIAGGARSN